MLGKLIKYDLKAISPVLLLIHGVLFALTIVVRMALAPHMYFMTDAESVMSILLSILLTLSLVGASYATYIFISVRFYKNVYSDEGYLTNTLPVTSGQLLLSKTISGSIWTFINTAFIFLSLYLVFIQPIFHALTDEEQAFFKFSDSRFAVVFVFSILLSVVSNVVMFYFSIILGQLFQAHRIIGAIACYFLLNTVVSVLSVIVLILSPFGNELFTPVNDPTALVLLESMSGIFISIDILMVIVTLICYIVSLHFMKKKRNLI